VHLAAHTVPVGIGGCKFAVKAGSGQGGFSMGSTISGSDWFNLG